MVAKIEKAYDHNDWRFFKMILQTVGFSEVVVCLIMNCTSHVSLSILLNGERLEEFHPSRGVRQGDPLSLYLFRSLYRCP